MNPDKYLKSQNIEQICENIIINQNSEKIINFETYKNNGLRTTYNITK